MPHQKQGNQGSSTWREARAKAVKAGRLNQAAVEAHKRRLLAELYGHAELQQDGDA